MCSTRTARSRRRCNMAMVELEPMLAEEEINASVYHHARDLEGHGLVEVMSDMTPATMRRGCIS